MQTTFIDSIHEIRAADWDGLCSKDEPFLRHAFLAALEDSGSVCEDTGWTPRHLLLRDQGRLVAALPLYEKSHSMGEYVFDWAWAEFWQRHGRAYYPKLLSAIPFTPIAGQRLLFARKLDLQQQSECTRTLCTAVQDLAMEQHASSWHVLFPNDADDALLNGSGLGQRLAWNYVWRNHDYRDFSDFLAALSSKKRKNISRERRQLTEQGIRIRRLQGNAIDDASWQAFYACYHSTYLKRGRIGYLNRDFFTRLRRDLSQHLILSIAERDGETLAGALCFRGRDALYGRYWGCLREIPGLHFECCYYSGIEYCIREGLGRFDPGVQGEHKIARGFLPSLTCSRHWIAEPLFREPIQRFLHDEAVQVRAIADSLQQHSPFKAL